MFDRRDNGVIYVASSQTLGPYPEKLTGCLVHWASAEPDRVFLAQRAADGAWRTLTYSRALQQVRSIAQSLLHRRLNSETPVLILSGNSVEHGLLALACLYVGVPYVPVSPRYTLSNNLKPLGALCRSLEPAMVLTDGVAFRNFSGAHISGADISGADISGADIPGAHMEWITTKVREESQATPLEALLETTPGPEIEEAHARVTADTVAKILFTSGSTGTPKGVITTQRMLCSNQQMIRTAMPFVAEEPPVLCDWLPWHHVFGGSHNFGMALYNGGSLYIDEGKPTANEFCATRKNLHEIAPTAYFNVPKGYRMLLSALRDEPALRQNFFSRLQVLFCAGASLAQHVWDELQDLAVATHGATILQMTALGATESGPMALVTGNEGASEGRVGMPVPGVELKLVPWEDKFEARLRGPSITPGYWRDPKATAAVFDEEGFYRLGDVLQFADFTEPLQGLSFSGRIADNFKLSTGTWVDVAAVREKLLKQLQHVALAVVITAPDRDYLGALIFPLPGVAPDEVRSKIMEGLNEFAQRSTGLSTCVQRALIMEEPPSLSNGELAAKDTINHQITLRNRAALVEELYAGSERILELNRTPLA